MNPHKEPSREIAAAAGAVLADLASLLGIPVNATSRLFRNWLNKRANEARDILLAELGAANISDLKAASEDDAIAVIYRYGLALRDGAARMNLKLLAQVIVGLGKREKLFSEAFNKYSEMLSRLTRDEILVIGTLHRYRKSEERRQGPTVSTHQYWPKAIAELVPSQFPSEEHVIAVCCSAMRSGLIVTPRDFDSTGEFSSSPIMDEVAELTDFQGALAEGRNKGVG